jgi:hypothetical protein
MASSSENTGAPPEEEQPQAPPTPNPEPTEAAAPGEAEEEPQTLERAQELFDRGAKAIEDEDFVEAVDCLSQALEIRLGFPFPPPISLPSPPATLAVKRLRVLADFGAIGGWYGAFRSGSAGFRISAWVPRGFCPLGFKGFCSKLLNRGVFFFVDVGE